MCVCEGGGGVIEESSGEIDTLTQVSCLCVWGGGGAYIQPQIVHAKGPFPHFFIANIHLGLIRNFQEGGDIQVTVNFLKAHTHTHCFPPPLTLYEVSGSLFPPKKPNKKPTTTGDLPLFITHHTTHPEGHVL